MRNFPEKIRNQQFPRMSKMLPLAIFFYSPSKGQPQGSLPKIEVLHKFYRRPWLRSTQRRIIPTQMVKKATNSAFLI